MQLRRLFSAIATFAIAASVLVVAPVVTTPAVAADAPAAVTEGTITWGLKTSWRRYVGVPTMTGGVAQQAGSAYGGGPFDFPVTSGSFDADTGTTVLSGTGTLHWQAHEYPGSEPITPPAGYTGTDHLWVLDVTFSDPEVTISAAGATITADVVSRDAKTWELVDFGRIPMSTLDIAGVEPTVADGVTEWPELVTRWTDDAVAAIGYTPGAVVDPVSLHYTGPGGAPDLSEDFAAPGLVGLEMTEHGEFDDSVVARTGRVTTLWIDTVHKIAHVNVKPGSSATQYLRAYSLETFEFIGEPLLEPTGSAGTRFRNPVAVDLDHDRSYYGTTTSAISNYVEWDAGTGRYSIHELATPVAMPSSALWDPVGKRLLAPRLTVPEGVAADDYDDQLWSLRIATPGSDGELSVKDVPLPSGPAGRNQSWYAGTASAALASDGSIVLPPREAQDAKRIVFEPEVSVTEIPGTDRYASGEAADRVLAGPDGLLYVIQDNASTSTWSAFTLRIDGDSVSVSHDAVPYGATQPATYAVDPTDGTLWAYSDERELIGIRDGRIVATQYFPRLMYLSYFELAVDAEGSIFVSSNDGVVRPSQDGYVYGFARVERTGVSPSVVSSPADRTAVLGRDATVRFSATGAGSPTVHTQWQQRAAGALVFTDMAGKTSSDLDVDVTAAANGSEYRAIFTTAAGRIASEPATLTVHTPPSVGMQPVSLSVAKGGSAEFSVMPEGSPDPAVTWETWNGSAWTTVASDGAYLRLSNLQPAQNGTKYRAKLVNEAGTAYSDEATLTVTGSGVPSTGTTLDGVTLEWTGNPEMQKAPFSGDSNYFSAGASDGTAATYKAKAGDVTIVQRAANGTEATATFATKAKHVNAGGKAAQIVRFGGGHAEFAADGSGTVTWKGTWSVNFYAGAIPFTVTDPVLTVDSKGAGALTVTIGGYSSDIADPSSKTPIPPVRGVQLATFHNVRADLVNGFAVTPDYAGVVANVPAGQTPQDRTTSGWGAWPQSFVDVQFTTGLSSYWYSSASSLDAYKKPNAFAVSVAGATSALPDPPAVTPSKPSDDGGTTTGKKKTAAPKEGSLLWGVKSSFRSYITGPIAHGAITLSGGAATKSGTYWFGQRKGGDFFADEGTGSAKYRGSVRFTGHGGLLDLTLSNPVVRVDSAKKATLLVSVNGGSAIEFATIDLSKADRSAKGGAVSYSGAPVALAAAGTSAFANGSQAFYGAGTAMDPVSFTIGSPSDRVPGATTVAAAKKDTFVPPATPPATEGIDSDTLELTPGVPFTGSASGFEPDEQGIAVVVYSDPVVLATDVTADASGVASWSGILPVTLEPGEHTVTFQGSVARGVVVTVAAAAADECAVTDASLTWGFKDSFRSYISGSIANGKWTVAGGATYKTPDFGWSAGTGSFDDFVGRVAFPGSIRFTGHDGVLDTTIANPELLFVDSSTAYILLDVSGPTMDGDPVDAKDVSFVKLDLAGGDVTVADGVVTAVDVPAVITAEGYATFPNYKEGTAFDPVSFTITTDAACGAVVPAPTSEPTSEPVAAGDDAQAANFTVPLAIGGGVLVIVVIVLLVLLLRRRRAAP